MVVSSVLRIRINCVEGSAIPSDSEIYVEMTFQSQKTRSRPCFGQTIASAFRESFVFLVLSSNLLKASPHKKEPPPTRAFNSLSLTVYSREYNQDVVLGQLAIDNILELRGKTNLDLTLLGADGKPAGLQLICTAEHNLIFPSVETKVTTLGKATTVGKGSPAAMKKSSSAPSVNGFEGSLPNSPIVLKGGNKGIPVSTLPEGIFTDHQGQIVPQPYIPQYLSFFENWFRERGPFQEKYYLAHFVDRIDAHLPITKELIGYCLNGVSYHHRGEMWMKLSGAKKRMLSHPRVYNGLVEAEKNEAIMDQIDSDIPRTFPANPLVTPNFQNRLRRLLGAYSVYDKQTGYCQSLNFIGAFFLFVLEEEEAFWLLVTLIQLYLPYYYDSSLVGSKADLQILEKLIMTSFPEVGDSFLRMGIPIPVRMAPWFMCLFVGVFPTETAMRVFDWLFAEGSHVLFSVALGLVDLNREALRDTKSFESAFSMLNRMTDEAFDADRLLKTASSKFPLAKTDISQLRADVQAQIREKDSEDLLKQSKLDDKEFTKLIQEFNKASNTSTIVDDAKFRELAARILPDLPSEIVPQLFKALDRDGDGSLTAREFALGFAALSQGTIVKKAKLVFACFDKDQSGTLDQLELREMFETLLTLFHGDKSMDTAWIPQLFATAGASASTVASPKDSPSLFGATSLSRTGLTLEEFIDVCENIPVLSNLLLESITFPS